MHRESKIGLNEINITMIVKILEQGIMQLKAIKTVLQTNTITTYVH